MIPSQLKGVSVPMSPALSRIRWATLIGSYLFGSTTMSGAGSQDWFSCFNFPTVIYGGPNYPIVGKGVVYRPDSIFLIRCLRLNNTNARVFTNSTLK